MHTPAHTHPFTRLVTHVRLRAIGHTSVRSNTVAAKGCCLSSSAPGLKCSVALRCLPLLGDEQTSTPLRASAASALCCIVGFCYEQLEACSARATAESVSRARALSLSLSLCSALLPLRLSLLLIVISSISWRHETQILANAEIIPLQHVKHTGRRSVACAQPDAPGSRPGAHILCYTDIFRPSSVLAC